MFLDSCFLLLASATVDFFATFFADAPPSPSILAVPASSPQLRRRIHTFPGRDTRAAHNMFCQCTGSYVAYI
jgi:hypothetical protein